MSEYTHVDQHYAPHVESARAQARTHASVRALLEDELGPDDLLGFLIDFAAAGVRILRPVETHLRRGAMTCADAGFDSLGADLTRMSKDATSRRLRLIDDLVQLATMWRERGGPVLDLGLLVRRPAPHAALRKATLRELAAAAPLPFDLLGIELELGTFAVEFGPQLMRACERQLGSDILDCLTYLQARTEHAALRTDDMLERLDDLLRAVPELGEPTASAGTAALEAHIHWIAGSVDRGPRLAGLAPAHANLAVHAA